MLLHVSLLPKHIGLSMFSCRMNEEGKEMESGKSKGERERERGIEGLVVKGRKMSLPLHISQLFRGDCDDNY